MLKKPVVLAVLAVICTNPAYAQGFSEYGSLLGASPRAGTGSLNKAVNNLYNRGAYLQPSAKHGGGSRAGSGAGPRLSGEQLAQYTAQANSNYTAALAAQKAGKLDQAVKGYAASLAVRERIWGFADPAVGEIARKQAEILIKQGKHKEAEDAYRKVLACESRRFGSDSPQATKVLITLATLCDQQGKNTDSLAFYRQLYGIRKNQAATSEETRAVRLRLASLLTGSSDFAGAEQVLAEGVSAEQGQTPPDNAYLSKLYTTYAAVYKAQGKDADAQQWESKAAAATPQPIAAEPTRAEPAKSDSAPSSKP